jgi:germination protein M
MQRLLQLVGVFFILVLLLTGCFGSNEKTAIDPPPEHALDAEAVHAKQKQEEAKKEKGKQYELYFFDAAGHVVPYSVELPAKKEIVKEALTQMVEGSSLEAQLPKGFKAVLPKGTKVKGINVRNGTATVNFSKEFMNYDANKEEQLFSAITWSLTGFGKIKKVNIWVNGHPLVAKGKSPTQGLSRADGINLEIPSGVNIGQSMPVTLYFLAQAEDETIYYVPVTRMVNRSANVAETVLQELVRGPMQGSNLFATLDSSTVINQVKQNGDTLYADFGDQLLEYNSSETAAKHAVDSIVLSLTENINAKKVKITVNGKNAIETSSDGDQNDLGLPVSRPEKINPAPM